MVRTKEKTRDVILRVARQHFINYGYAGTTLNNIAEEINLTRGPFYYYFSNKEDLFNAVVENECNQLKSKYTEIFTSDKDIYQQLYEDVVFCSEQKAIIDVITQQVPNYNSTVVYDAHSYIYNIKKEALIRAIEKKEIRKDADLEEMLDFLYVYVKGVRGYNQYPIFYQGEIDSTHFADLFIKLFKTQYGFDSE